MAKLPIAEDQIVFSGARFAAPSVQSAGNSPLTQALTQWSDARREQQRREAAKRIQGQAISEQLQINTTGVAQPPPDLDAEMQDLYRSTAATVYGERVKLEGAQFRNQVTREFPDNPQEVALRYNEWMAGKLEAIREVDPVGAFEMQMRLEQDGLNTLATVQDAAASRARAVQAAEAADVVAQTRTTLQDSVLRSGSEVALAEARTTFDEMLDTMVATGTISLDYARSQKAAAARDFTREMYFGQFERLARNPDSFQASAEALIAHAESGVLFDDNDDGRVLAGQLAQDLRARLGPAEKEVEGLMAANRAVVSSAVASFTRTGRAPMSPLIEQAILTLESSDNVNDRQTALQARAAFQMGDVPAAIRRMSPAELDAVEAQAPGLIGVVPDAVVSMLDTMVPEQRARVLEARRGDPMQLVDEDAAETDQAGFDWWAQQRPNVSRMTGLPLDEIPVYSRAKAEGTAEMFREALRRERPDEALEVLLDYMPPDRVPRHEMAAIAMQHNIPELGSAGVLLAAGGEQFAQVALGLMNVGQRLPEQDRNDAMAEFDDDHIQLTREASEALSMGSTTVSSQLGRDLRDLWVGLWHEEQQGRGDAKDRYEQILDSIGARETLENGRRVPAGFFQPFQLDAINDAFDNPTALFGDQAEDAGFMETVYPVPGPDGALYWRSSLNGGVYLGDSSGQPVKVTPNEPTLREQVRTGYDLKGNLLASRGLLPGGRLHTLDRTLPVLAEAAGADATTLRALFTAAVGTSQADVPADRNFTAGYAESNLDLLDMDAFDAAWADSNIWRASQVTDIASAQEAFPVPPDPWDSPDGSVLAGALILDALEKKYSDPDQIMVAYLVGADAVDAAGDNWRRMLETTEVAAYMARVRRAMSR